MPIYEYQCRDCGTRLEKMQKISDAPLQICEKCGGKLEKQVSLSGFQFKGEGWYVTDYSAKKGDEKSAVSGKTEKAEKTESGEKAEKSSAGESTTKSETASNTKSDNSAAAKKD